MDSLFETFSKGKAASIIVHTNPDPDALASALGLRYLLKSEGYTRVRVFYDGLIGRAENQAMVKVLNIPLHRISNIASIKNRQFVLVDCQPYAGNVSLPDGAAPVAVIDHHPRHKATSEIPYVDIRPEYGACSTIIGEYILECELSVPAKIASALVCGISSETQFLGREGSAADKKIYKESLTNASFELLSQIQFPKISKDFVNNLSDSLLNIVYYKNFIGVLMDELPYPDFVAEMADFVLRIKNMTWFMCLGAYQETLYISLRTSNLKADASRIIIKAISGEGSSGGHNIIAGAQIDVSREDEDDIQALGIKILRKMLKLLNHSKATELFRLSSDEKFPLI
jgi:nanoRNase/pAp phosphatase (c-di-AMP/oligoRNAs hydrolase)